jgi:hypothetical protein
MTGYTFNQLFDFTRTTSGTFVGSNGILQTTPASVNLLLYTQEFDNAAWGKTGVTVTANSTTAPDGTTTADTQVENTSTGTHDLTVTTTITAGQITTLTFFLKASGRSLVRVMQTWNGTTDRVHADFDLSNGTVGAAVVTGTAVSASAPVITSFGNGWYRCQISGSCPTGTAILSYARMMSAAGVVSYTGDGTSGIFIWGAQLQLGSTATTYARNNGGLFPARFDYDPVTRAPRGILIEEQRTNLATYSNDFADASWTAFGTKNLVANSTVSPDGAVNASTLTDNSAVAFQGTGKTVTVANDNATYTASIYVRKTTGGTSATFGVNLQLTGGTLVTAQPRLNTDTGALINGTGTVQNAGAYWRLTTTVTNNTTGNTTLALAVYPATAAYNSGTDSAAATGSAIIYGAQLEAGSFPTSYIPTVASQVTRSADICTISAPMFAPWYRQSEGTFVVDVGRFSSVNTTGFATFVAATDNPISNDWIYIIGDGNVTVGNYTNSGVAQANLSAASPITSGGKAAFAYALNDFASSVSGGAVLTDTSGTLSTDITILRVGSFAANPNFLNGHIRRITYYPFRASNNQLQALTT